MLQPVRSVAITALMIVLTSSAAFAQREVPLPLSVAPGELVVIDGDTVDRPGANVRYRLYGLDAPEIRGAGCNEEEAAGERARTTAARLIRQARVIRIEPTGRVQRATEQYRERQEAGLVLDGRDFNQLMIAAGVARQDAEDDERWCDALPRPCNP